MATHHHKMTPSKLIILRYLETAEPSGARAGAITQATELNLLQIYSDLTDLKAIGWIATGWDQALNAMGKTDPKQTYRLTDLGRTSAKTEIMKALSQAPTRRRFNWLPLLFQQAA